MYDALEPAAIISVIRKRFKSIAIITISAAVCGLVIFKMATKKYVAQTEFLVRNPMYGDRTIIYNNEPRLADYFAGEDVLDKIIVLYSSDIVRQPVIKRMDVAAVYKLDTNKKKDVLSMEGRFNKALDITRTEYGHMRLTFEDADPVWAMAVANEFVVVLDSMFNGYYREMRRGMYESIRERINEQDSSISALTDTLAAIRDRYGIYSSKYNLTVSNINADRSKKYGAGLEEINNLELRRDALLSDRMTQVTIMNHYQTGLEGKQLSLIKVITPAKILNPPGAMKLIAMVLICGIAGLFFSILLALFSESFVKK